MSFFCGSGGALAGHVEDFAEALGGSGGLLELGDNFREGAERGTDEDGEEDEGEEVFPGDAALRIHARAVPNDEGDGAEEGEDDEGKEGTAGFRDPEGDGEEGLEGGLVAVLLEGLVGESFDVGDVLDGFLDDCGGVGERFLRGLGVVADFSPEDGDEEDDDGNAAEHDEREFP